MRAVGTRFELRVKLDADEEIILWQLDCLNDETVRRPAADHHAVGLHEIKIIVIEFIAVAMALTDQIGAIAAVHQRIRLDSAGISAKPHGAAFFDLIVLSGHEVNDQIPARLRKFA